MFRDLREDLPRTSTFKVAAGKPATIDLTTIQEGDKTTLHTKGIYSIAGDVLTYCIAAPDLPRPTEFDMAKREGYTLVVLKRVP